MKPINYNAIVANHTHELEGLIEQYGHEHLYNENELWDDYSTSWLFDKKQSCFWAWDIEDFMNKAYDRNLITENDFEEFLMHHRLGIK